MSVTFLGVDANKHISSSLEGTKIIMLIKFSHKLKNLNRNFLLTTKKMFMFSGRDMFHI